MGGVALAGYAHSLPDQIAADRYLEGKKATRKSGLGIPLKKLSPPGAP